MPFFICPNCRQRTVDLDGYEGFSSETVQCRSCGFGFLFELMDDYFPAPTTGFVVCDREGRVLAVGRGVFELTGFAERDLMGKDIVAGLGLSDSAPFETVREWGVRQLGRKLRLRTKSSIEKPVTVDLFPAYDEDGGLLVALTAA